MVAGVKVPEKVPDARSRSKGTGSTTWPSTTCVTVRLAWEKLLRSAGAPDAVRTRPVIVAGDLNTTPWSHGFQRLIRPRGLRDSAVGHGVQTTWNARRWVPRIPIDHVVVSPEVRVVARRVGPDVGSDHLPIEATLAVP